MKTIAFIFLFVVSFQSSVDESVCLFRLKDVRKFGFITTKGKVVVPAGFDWVDDNAYYLKMDDLLPFMINKKWGFVNRMGRVVIDAQYDLVTQFQGRHYTIVMIKRPSDLDGKKVAECYGIIDKTGNMVIEPRYSRLSMNENTILFELPEKKNQWGVMTFEGKVVIEPREYKDSNNEYYHGGGDLLLDFYKGRIFVPQGGRYGLQDMSGSWIVKPSYADVRPFCEDLAAVKINNRWGFINLEGEIVIPPQFTDVLSDRFGFYLCPETDCAVYRVGFKDGVCFVKTNRWGLIDNKGKFVISPRYDDVKRGGFTEGLAPVKIGGKWGFIDRTGKTVIKPVFHDVENFSDGYAVYKLAGVKNRHGSIDVKHGYIDTTGTIRIRAQFLYAGNFRNGYAYATRYRSDGMDPHPINKKGEFFMYKFMGADICNDPKGRYLLLKYEDREPPNMNFYDTKTGKMIFERNFYRFYDTCTCAHLDLLMERNKDHDILAVVDENIKVLFTYKRKRDEGIVIY